jgi:D-alanine transaminase
LNRTVYVNGEFLPQEQAKISVFDRGFLFADAVYEVTSIMRGRLIDNRGHLRRLRRSLDELDMPSPASDAEIESIQKKLVALNEVDEGLVYLQITRGVAERDFIYPPATTPPSLVMFTAHKQIIASPTAKVGISVISVPDIRWQRRDIKTTGLLAASMCKMQAKADGADDAWFVEHGQVTEGSSNNAYIITRDGTLVTRQLGDEILAGITRQAILRFAEEQQISIEQRPFTIDEAIRASEAFITSATTLVLPVVSINGQPISDGKPGKLTSRLRQIYIQTMLESSEAEDG